jgi:hypothetical protein
MAVDIPPSSPMRCSAQRFFTPSSALMRDASQHHVNDKSVLALLEAPFLQFWEEIDFEWDTIDVNFGDR